MNIKNKKSWYVLAFSVSIYIVLFFINQNIFWTSYNFFTKTLIKIAPIFIFIFILMVLTNRYIDNYFIVKHLRGSLIKKWFYIIVGGILSTGPLYVWYPLLKNLKEKGLTDGEIASFLWNRSIKPAYLPIMISYFSLNYTILLTITIIITSFLQAFIVDISTSFNKEIKQ